MCERCERRRSREPPLSPWLEPLDPLAVATPPYLLGGGSYPPATCVVFLGGGFWVSLFRAPPPEAKRARPRKKIAFASRKFSPSATVQKFKIFRPSEALARENFPISNISRPRVVLYFLLSRARYTRLLSLVYFYMGMENLPPLGPRVGDQKIVAVCFAQPLSCCFIRF